MNKVTKTVGAVLIATALVGAGVAAGSQIGPDQSELDRVTASLADADRYTSEARKERNDREGQIRHCQAVLELSLMQLNELSDASTALIDPSCLLYTSPSPRDGLLSRMPSSA